MLGIERCAPGRMPHSRLDIGLRQIGDAHRDAPRLVACEPVHYITAGLAACFGPPSHCTLLSAMPFIAP
jgi:hypothetical protein